MTNDIDFNELGKKTPYRIPEGFFDEMQQNVLQQIDKPRHRKTMIIRLSSITVGIAAATAAFILIPRTTPEAEQIKSASAESVSNNWIEQLSDEELQAAYDFSENDIFMD